MTALCAPVPGYLSTLIAGTQKLKMMKVRSVGFLSVALRISSNLSSDRRPHTECYREYVRISFIISSSSIMILAMSIIRMVKMFGWEPKMSARISKIREEELYYNKKLRMLEILTGISK